VPLNGMFHVVIKKQRGAVFEGIMNITANKTAFKLFSIMLPYGMEPYSIAFRALDNSYGFALSFLQASSIRNKNSLFVTYFDENGYYTDDAGKYIDVSKFGVGL
ncbi:MAG: hypothetical protein N2486_10535, partial [Caloramator sp.]|nr:hypothetical protein [Caloramator sp.]